MKQSTTKTVDQGHSWTIVEGHFLQMGGILFRIRGEARFLALESIHRNVQWESLTKRPPQHSLCSRGMAKLQRLHKTGITADEVTDRSKGDALTKGLVILQTSWFTTQCVLRAVQGIAITELEIITLGYAALNGVMYFFWWYKPLDVQCPVLIDLDDDDDPTSLQAVEENMDPGNSESTVQDGQQTGQCRSGMSLLIV